MALMRDAVWPAVQEFRLPHEAGVRMGMSLQPAEDGRVLVRAEVTDSALLAEDEALIAATEAEVRRWTGTAAPFGFTKAHRFSTIPPSGDSTECHTRVSEIVRRAPGLSRSLSSPS